MYYFSDISFKAFAIKPLPTGVVCWDPLQTVLIQIRRDLDPNCLTLLLYTRNNILKKSAKDKKETEIIQS